MFFKNKKTIEINDIKAFFNKAKILSTLNKDFPSEKKERRNIQYILVGIKDDDVQHLEKTISELCKLAIDNKATIGEMLSSVLVFYFGIFESKQDDLFKRKQLIAEIKKQYGKDVKLIHGECEVVVGTFGTDGFYKFGVLMPNFMDKLSFFSQISIGEESSFS